MTNKAYKTTFEGLEDMQSYVGKEIGLSEWLSIDQDMINQFAVLTKDEQWIHCDPERSAVHSPFKTTIAHGFLVVSFFSHFLETCIDLKGGKMGVNYGFDKLRFTNSVAVDAKIRARFKLLEVVPRDGGARFKYGVSIEIEGQEKPACVAEWLGLVYV